MTAIGNDIVDLKTIDIARTCKPQFYSKILSAAEQQLFNVSLQLPFQNFVWLFWSVKEAAYKCLQRHQSDLVFSPVKIEVRLIAPPIQTVTLSITDKLICTGFNEPYYKAEININNKTLYARSVIYGDELIHTIVCLDDSFDSVYWGTKHIGTADLSAAVRIFLAERLNALFPGEIFNIVKDAAGVPSVIIKEKTLLPVSLSHHGSYVGYAMSAMLI